MRILTYYADIVTRGDFDFDLKKEQKISCNSSLLSIIWRVD